MTIETKYNIGDEVWTIADNEVRCSVITDVSVRLSSHPLDIHKRGDKAILMDEDYKLDFGSWRPPHLIFKTKEGLLKSL